MRRRIKPVETPDHIPPELAEFDPDDWPTRDDHHCDIGRRHDAWGQWLDARSTWRDQVAAELDIDPDDVRLPDYELADLDLKFCYGCI